MECNKQTDDLLNLIRKELTAIIDDKKPKVQEKSATSTPTSTDADKALPILKTVSTDVSARAPSNSLKELPLIDISVDNLLKRSETVIPKILKIKPRKSAEKLVLTKTEKEQQGSSTGSYKQKQQQRASATTTTTTNVKNPLKYKKSKATAAAEAVLSTTTTATTLNKAEGITKKPHDSKIEDELQYSNSKDTNVSDLLTNQFAADAFSKSSTAARSMEFLESQVGKSIDEDMQKMKLELKQSYELIQSVGQKFNAIDFSMLRTRVRDLHLQNKSSYADLQKDFEKSCVENRLHDITSDAANTFRRHPGEFGDIPELSAFFTACTQLQHGLDKLSIQRKQKNELERRMNWASEIAYERMNEIRTAVGQDPEKNF